MDTKNNLYIKNLPLPSDGTESEKVEKLKADLEKKFTEVVL